jgi:hypothetical protein
MKALRSLPVLAVLGMASLASAQVSITTSYTQDFDSLGSGLPAGWNVWTSSTATGNGSAFTWNTAALANNATVNATNYFRNLPGASQTWSSTLSAGSDRALGWRAGNAASRDGSITFSLANTAGYTLTSLSFQLFTPNSVNTAGTFQLQYQLGTGGTFTPLAGVSYTNDTAHNPLTVTTITLTGSQLTALNNSANPLTLRWDNVTTGSTAFQTLALDNFSYTATAVPEPATCTLLIGALALTGVLIRRRRLSPAA